MPYSSGTWTAAASSWNPAVAGTAISVTDWATLLADISTGLSTCILKDGSQTATALVPFAQGLSAGAAAAFNVNSSGTVTAAAGITITTNGLTVSAGHAAIDGAINASYGINIASAALTGTGQIGVYNGITASTAATGAITGYTAALTAASGTYTIDNVYNYNANDLTKAGGSITATILHGFNCSNLTTGATNIGYRSQVTSGTNKWNFYADGTADNYLAGLLRIGTTAALINETSLTVKGTTSNNVAVLQSVSQGNWPEIVWNTATSGDNSFIQFGTEGSYTARGSIDFNRAGGAVRYNTTSDQRLKRDLRLATDTSVLQALRIHEFEWKENGNRGIGVFAQEAYLVYPNAISKGDDDEAVSKPWGASYSSYVPHLVVGWQDHEARIRALEAR